MAQDDLVVTGEAVALELPVASVGVRALSGFLDVALAMILVVGGILAIAAVSPLLDEALLGVAMILLTAGVLVGLPAATEALTRGRTVGKLVTGLRTVRRDGGAITFRHAFIRSLLGVVEVYLLWGVPALFSAIFSPRGQRVGDLVAGTYVVRDRFGLALPPPLPCPPPLLAWAHDRRPRRPAGGAGGRGAQLPASGAEHGPPGAAGRGRAPGHVAAGVRRPGTASRHPGRGVPRPPSWPVGVTATGTGWPARSPASARWADSRHCAIRRRRGLLHTDPALDQIFADYSFALQRLTSLRFPNDRPGPARVSPVDRGGALHRGAPRARPRSRARRTTACWPASRCRG